MPPRKKKISAIVKVQLQAGAATPAPPVGTALGPHGVNIMDFCKQYNAATESQRGNVVPAEITIYEDRTFSFITKTPPAPELIKKAVGVEKGSGEPHKEKVGKITQAQLRQIAQTKMADLNARDLEHACRVIAGLPTLSLPTVAGIHTFADTYRSLRRAQNYRSSCASASASTSGSKRRFLISATAAATASSSSR